MAICPTPNCGEKLLVHSRRKYCYKCRAMMGRWAKRTPAEITLRLTTLVRGQFRIEHLKERKLDQNEALSQLRRSRKKRS